MNVLCIDVGNSNTHLAVVNESGIAVTEQTPTKSIAQVGGSMGLILDKLISSGGVMGVSFCSVVPGIYPHLLKHLRIFTTQLFNLTHKTCLGIEIDYPNPSEIGQDRLANAIGVQSRYGAPAIVIDMGTALTLDVVSPDRGYEGGVIAPGLAVMARYLHEKTALLPEVDVSAPATLSLIGKSTQEAMTIGCRRGFAGMVEALVVPIARELETRCGQYPHLIAAGGDARHLCTDAFPQLIVDSGITMIGLREAFCRYLAQGPR
jgi:type III pantothenate kinase